MWKRVQTSREAALNGLAAVVLSIIDLICMRSQGDAFPSRAGVSKKESVLRMKAWPEGRRRGLKQDWLLDLRTFPAAAKSVAVVKGIRDSKAFLCNLTSMCVSPGLM